MTIQNTDIQYIQAVIGPEDNKIGIFLNSYAKGEIIGTFKSLCVNNWLIYLKENKIDALGKFWQRNYYEHIIRNENELTKIREYIQNNPLKWSLDRENPNRIGVDVLEDEISK